MSEINDLIAQQCELIMEKQRELDEIRELMVEAGINNDGSYRDGVCELIYDLDDARKENVLLEEKIEALRRALAEAVEERGGARAERDAAEDTASADITDALAEYLHSIGQPAKPIRSTGNRALDELVRVCG